nr:hypothetical protein Iba_chr10eCG5520 [Ipomoea batatas]
MLGLFLLSIESKLELDDARKIFGSDESLRTLNLMEYNFVLHNVGGAIASCLVLAALGNWDASSMLQIIRCGFDSSSLCWKCINYILMGFDSICKNPEKDCRGHITLLACVIYRGNRLERRCWKICGRKTTPWLGLLTS